MRLLVTTPMSVVVDAGDVRHVRAEDETGAFGILPGHADLITVLAVSVVTWRDRADKEHHIAVYGGVLTVDGGDLVEIATRKAVGEDTFRQLARSVLAQTREETLAEHESRTSATRLHLAAIGQLQRYLESGRSAGERGGLPGVGATAEDDGAPGQGRAG